MTNPNGAKVPRVTADYTTLPNGDRVWVQTASDLQLDDIREEASWYAREKVMPFRKGEPRYKMLVEDIKANFSEEDRAALIAQAGYKNGEFKRIVDNELPKPVAPSREKDDTDEAFMKKQDEYLKELENIDKLQEEKYNFLYNDRLEAAKAYSSQKRVTECVERVISEKYAEAFDRGYTMHLLYVVVRKADDPEHIDKYFVSPKQLEDEKWAATRSHLCKFYNEQIDTVRQDAIPT